MSKRKILNISMPTEMYDTVSLMAKDENKTKAELAREIIAEYLTKRERWAEIRQWGSETAVKLGLENEEQLSEVIHQARRSSD